MDFSVLDFATPADALAAANHGDSVYFPGVGVHTGNWQITKSITVYGDGVGVPGVDSGTVLKPASATSPVFTLVPPIEQVTIRDMQIRGAGGSGSGVGIRSQSTGPNVAISDLRLARLAVMNFPSHGIHVEGFNDTTSAVSRLSASNCTMLGNGGVGMLLKNVFDAFLLSCFAKSNQQNGVSMIGGGGSVKSCGFDGNCLQGSVDPSFANLRIEKARALSVDGCRFENLHLPAGLVKVGIALYECSGGVVGLSYFRAQTPSAVRGIFLTGASEVSCGPIAILNNRFKNIEYLIEVDPGDPAFPPPDIRDLVVLPQFDETGSGTMVLPNDPNRGLLGSPQVNRGALGVLPTGLILPQVDSDPTANIQAGMLVYNRTSDQLRVYDGTAWKQVLVDP